MIPLQAKEIVGNWATLLLPINTDNSINFSALADEIDLLINAKVNGIYSNGTAGEFYNQTENEFDRISELLANKCHSAFMPFQIGCSHMSPQISLERVKRARHFKPSGIQVILPDWWKPATDEVLSFLQIITDAAAPIGIVLYNPPYSKKQLSPDEFLFLKEAGISLVGCKVAGGDESWYASMRKAMAHLSVFIPGHFLASGIRRGAQGAYSNVSCINPFAGQRWYELMQTDMEAALELEGRIQQFIHQYIHPFLLDGRYSNQAADKFMASVGGWTTIGPRLRWPYSSFPEGEIIAVRRQANLLIPEFFLSL